MGKVLIIKNNNSDERIHPVMLWKAMSKGKNAIIIQ